MKILNDLAFDKRDLFVQNPGKLIMDRFCKKLYFKEVETEDFFGGRNKIYTIQWGFIKDVFCHSKITASLLTEPIKIAD